MTVGVFLSPGVRSASARTGEKNRPRRSGGAVSGDLFLVIGEKNKGVFNNFKMICLLSRRHGRLPKARESPSGVPRDL